jgi:hypothetical protein
MAHEQMIAEAEQEIGRLAALYRRKSVASMDREARAAAREFLSGDIDARMLGEGDEGFEKRWF